MTTTAAPIKVTSVQCDHCSQQYFGKYARTELAIHVDRHHHVRTHFAYVDGEQIPCACAVGRSHTIVTDR